MRACLLLLLVLGVAACGSSGSGSSNVLAVATIGPGEGVLEVALGIGQREYRFWFAPGIGLLALAEDGVEHLRTAL